MRIFVTGATGFIGTELVKELLKAGHQVRGLARTDVGAEQLTAAGAEAHRGNLQDLDSLRRGATGMDVVVNLAFNHEDMSKFAEHGKDERQAVEALGSVLAPGKLLVVTSGFWGIGGAPSIITSALLNDAVKRTSRRFGSIEGIPVSVDQRISVRAAEKKLRKLRFSSVMLLDDCQIANALSDPG